MTRSARVLSSVILLLIAAPASAQRSLHWDVIDVEARLDAAGRLHVTETQTMVFTGDWNGGERIFNVRPRQQFQFVEILRDVGGEWQALRADGYVDDVDEFTWADATTLRWRSRAPDAPPFHGERLRYRLRYEMSNILLQDGDRYILDHDFLFPDRDEEVRQFTLALTLDPEWHALTEVPATFMARNIEAGDGFVVTVPMRFSGAGAPATFDTSRPPHVVRAVALMLGLTMVTVPWIIGREWSRGRFTPIETGIDAAWVQRHLLEYPAEVVGAAWDEVVGSPEVVAMIARMVSEGKLGSDVGKGGVLHLRLDVDRGTLQGRERTLVDRLFFNNRVTTNTQLVKQHYRKKGFDPGQEIAPELQAAVAAATPEGHRPRPLRFAPRILFAAGMILLLLEWFTGPLPNALFFLIGVGGCIVAGIALWLGTTFRWNIHWHQGHALLCLIPPVGAVLLASWFLWERVGRDEVQSGIWGVWATAVLAMWIVAVAANAMVSRQFAAGVAFRKRLAAARSFFAAQLREERPRLHDEWSPWLLALGLTKEMDDWSVQHAEKSSRRSTSDIPSTTSTSSSFSSGGGATWTGFGGGRSGGGGAGSSWTAAASGMAAGVAAPSSSGSGGGGSNSGGGSSSGGSSGGGGGGGW